MRLGKDASIGSGNEKKRNAKREQTLGYVREYRRRLKAGDVLLKIVVNESDLVVELEVKGWLPRCKDHEPSAIAAALSEALKEQIKPTGIGFPSSPVRSYSTEFQNTASCRSPTKENIRAQPIDSALDRNGKPRTDSA